MKVASWNINSINARLLNVLEWLDEQSPDILFLQEIKCQNDNFPYLELEEKGYQCHVHGQKSYNGVAILSKTSSSLVSNQLPGDDQDNQSRFIEVDQNGIRLINIYLPNGNGGDDKYHYKLTWMKRLIIHIDSLIDNETPFLIGGDFNVIPTENDCYNPKAWENDAAFKLDTRKRFRELIHMGLTDAFRVFNQNTHQYTFWDYQKGRWMKDEGIRIDHFLTSPSITDKLVSCVIDRKPRGQTKASDHTPILVEIES
jgi:exodeoxyribonuclease-3